jgi:drug/metabolite transporter (DMT)-like permease
LSARTDSSAAASSDPARARGRLLVIAAACLWGTSATLARWVFRDLRVPALEAVEMRLVVALAVLGPWLLLRNRAALRVRREDWGHFLILGLVGVTAVQGTYYYTIAALGVGLAILLQYLAPALIVGWEALRGARIGAPTIVAVLAALIGTVLLVGGVDKASFRATPLAWVAGFGSAISFAFYVLYSKRPLARHAPETVLFYTFAIAAIVWACVIPPARILAAGYGATTWLLFLALGLFSTLLPFACFYAGLRRLPAAEAGVLATTEPVIAILSAALILGEGLRSSQWLGAALVLAAAIAATVQEPATAKAHAETG